MSANNKPINAWLPSLAESVTPCPCPPEVSEHIPDTDKAETDGGIFIPCPILKVAVYSVCLDGISPCFHSHPVNGLYQPLNLE